MSDLVKFLLARIAEDEAVVRRAKEGHPLRPPYDWCFDVFEMDDGMGPWQSVEVGLSRVLAECEAKRRIAWKHTPFHVTTKNDGLNWDYRGCGECHTPEGAEEGQTWWPCATLRLLALPYADHPDYDEKWRP